MSYLLLHGFTGAASAWSAIAPRLDSPIVCPALAGHLGGPTPESFEHEVDRLVRLAPARCHIVGYSLGARLALGAVIRHPNRFARATLIGVNPGLHDAERPARIAADLQWALHLRTDGVEAFVDAWERLPLFETQRNLPDEARDRQRRTRFENDAEGLALVLERLGLGTMPDYREASASVSIRVDIVAGEHDERFLGLAVDLAGVLPDATVHVVRGAGHNVLLERPDALLELITTAP